MLTTFSLQSVATNSDLFEHLINEWHIGPGLPSNENTCTVELKVRTLPTSQMPHVILFRLK